MTRIIDRGAITAAYVGIGMAATIAVSFLLVIPIEPIYWLLALPAGLLIGYYANQRSDRRAGPWPRIVKNALFAGLATGLTLAILLLAVKALFFFADNGFPDFNRLDQTTHQPVPPYCSDGADCVYERYVLAGHGAELSSAGITDAASFTRFYWGQQGSSAATVLVLTLIGGLGGGLLYGTFRPRTGRSPSSFSVVSEPPSH
ncbi:MAG TPA: hypothetical protein VFI34_05420 [Candidatus Limnocylindrales bacterium]|nr:hypothetical protein [Candidatus Limnocylindrales bacterium]